MIDGSSANFLTAIQGNAGDLGVGTATPSSKLDVEGSITSGPKGTAAGEGGAIVFEELAANGTNTVGFRAPDVVLVDVLWQLPGADGANGDVLSTDGSGVLSWVANGAGAGGDVFRGGNADNAALILGTTDAFGVKLQTEGIDALEIGTGQRVTVPVGLNLGEEKEIRFLDAAGGQYVSLKAPSAVPVNVNFTLPSDDGAVSYTHLTLPTKA